MTISYTLVPMPRWYFADNSGRPLGGGYMVTKENLNPQVDKPIYSSSSGDPSTQWPNPVFFDANGEAPGPFFWSFDDSLPGTQDQSYYIAVYDSDDNLMFQMSGFGPGVAGGGGGGSTTVNNFLENYVVNNVFLNYSGNNGVFSNIQSGTVIAPSNHHGLIKSAPSPVQTNIPYVGPDIMFVRSNDTPTDNLTVTAFNLGDNFLSNDITPEFYVDLECTAVGSGNTLKCVQFPIDLHVKNLEQTQISFLIWAKGVSGTQTMSANFVQYFGQGAATAAVPTPFFGSTTITNGSWNAYQGTITSTPSVSGKVLGNGGDDATYLQICFPASATFKIQFTKPKIYPGQITSVFKELQTYDYVDRIINSPRTGDYRLSMNSHAPFGWVAANDGSIGTPSSGATNRANKDTWPLYALLYTNVLDNWAPVSGGRTGTTIADAYTDFNANRKMTLTRALGRVIASGNAYLNTPSSFTASAATQLLTLTSTTNYPTGTPIQFIGLTGTALSTNTVYYVINVSTTTLRVASTLDNAYAGTQIGTITDGSGTIQTALGAYFGESTHMQTAAEVGVHVHIGESSESFAMTGSPGNAFNNTGANAGGFHGLTGPNVGGPQVAFPVIQPSVYANVFLKL